MLDACVRVNEAKAAGNTPDPVDVEDCNRWKQILHSIRTAYVISLFPPSIPQPSPVSVIPGLDRFFGDPSPQPSIFARGGVPDVLLGEIVLDAIKREPTPAHMLPMLRQIRDSEAQLEVVKGLIKEFDQAREFLQQEFEALQR